MAEIYKRVSGQKVERVVARTRKVQKAIDQTALARGIRAEALLRAHTHQGHARIDVEKGDIDAYVVLDDERGLKAALSIEYGRTERVEASDEGEPRVAQSGMEGLFILHRAFGLKHGGG